MKRVLFLLAATLFTVAAFGEPSGHGSAAGFPNIVWLAPTNEWPRRLWIYQEVPQHFSPSVVSRLLALGSLSAKDRTTVRDYIDSDDQVIFYGNPDGKSRHLAICPALGFIEYHDGMARSSSQLQPVDSVPDEKETTRLGLNVLKMLGIHSSDLSKKRGSGELNLHWERQTLEYTDPETKSDVTVTNAYGVFFLRRLDGIDVEGIGLNGGAYMSFGNEGKPVDLQVSWRNLKRTRHSECLSPHQISERINEGAIPLHPIGSTSVYAEPARKLTITKAMLFYDGKHYDEKMNLVTPFASFEAMAESGTNTTSLWFEVPMTVDR